MPTPKMRTISLIAGLAVALVTSACGARIQNYSYVAAHEYPPTPGETHIETIFVGYGETPDDAGIDEAFDIIAHFNASDMWGTGSSVGDKAIEKAREIGGHAVVVEPRQGNLTEWPGARVWVIRMR